MSKNRDTYIQALSIITSCGCNLNCSYCRIAQSKNANSADLQKKTIAALQDGTFLANIDKVLNRIDQSTSQISNMAFWGQEPTLTLQYITEHIEEWFTYFPNWEEVMFSTNTISHMDRIYDFAMALDKHCKVPTFNLNLQCSYDGDYSTNNLRKGSASTIHDNIKWLIEKFNDVRFEKVKVRLVHHGVLSLDLLSKLQTPEAILEYSNHMVDWGREFNLLNHNRRVETFSEVDIALENPVEACTMDGLRLKNFCAISNRLNPSKRHSFNYKLGDVDPAQGLYKSAWTPLHMVKDTINRFGCESLDELIDAIMQDPFMKRDVFEALNNHLYCGNGWGELKIMYDGTLVNCQNHIFETQEEFINDPDERILNVKKALASHNYFVNGITASEAELDKYYKLFYNGKHTSFEFTFKNVLMLMKMLSIVGQIDESYYDYRKMVKHAMLIAIMGCCSYNNFIMTGSLFMRHTGYIRLLANGYLDYVIEDFNNHEGRVVI